jgi:hypothetical protein
MPISAPKQCTLSTQPDSMAADLALQAELLAIGRQQQLDGGRVEADAVVQRLHAMALVDAADRHHAHQDVHRLDEARVAREQRFDVKRFVRLDHEIDPRTGDVDPRQVLRVVDDLVDLGNDDAVLEGGRFDQRRRVLGARPRVQVAGAVGLVAGHHHHVRRQVDVQARVQLDVGVQRADLQRALLQELRDAQALRAGEREIELAGDAALEQVEVLRQADARHDHVQALHLAGIDLHQGAREEVGLFLIVTLEYDAVAADDQALQRFDEPVGAQDGAFRQVPHGLHAPLFFLAPRVPPARRSFATVHHVSFVRHSGQHSKTTSRVQST